ncbi:RNA recognition motif 2-domain-containing protein [Gamsiella multidivaricata]|uniref:RNA recognition motif 2-domain-containing protein n=1 Tax=Gamsiella multidivaricata TaxID=101098 RepID=UPI00221E658C|nr:RNA recognition motif 2-domain-containing protein [Gamsiella multidivaricata]KAI7823843.1 RNA recognition motif 2-domain-containing protein [Gamsiella multidivaricata]
MTLGDQELDSVVLKYMMQDFSQLSLRKVASSAMSPQADNEASGSPSASTKTRPVLELRRPSQGAESLFFTDYEKYDWLGYGNRHRLSRGQEQANTKDLAVSNEKPYKSFSLFEEAMPATPRLDLDLGLNLNRDEKCLPPDSNYSPEDLDIVGKENIDPNPTSKVGIPTGDQKAVPRPTAKRAVLSSPFEPNQTNATSRGLSSAEYEPTKTSHASGVQCSVQRSSSKLFSPWETSTEAPQQAVGAAEQTLKHGFAPLPHGPFFELDRSDYGPGLLLHSSALGDRRLDLFPERTAGASTRHLKISNVSRDLSIWAARDALKKYGDLKGIFTAYLERDGVIFIDFFDIRHAMIASRLLYSNATFNSSAISVQFVSKAAMAQVSLDVAKNDNAGILLVSMAAPKLGDNDLLRLLGSYGDIKSFQAKLNGWPQLVLAEYYDTRRAAVAKEILETLHRKKQIYCQASFYRDDKATAASGAQYYEQPSRNHRDSAVVNPPSSLERLMTASGWLMSPSTHHQADSAIASSPADPTLAEFVPQRRGSPPLFPPLSDPGLLQQPESPRGSPGCRHSDEVLPSIASIPSPPSAIVARDNVLGRVFTPETRPNSPRALSYAGAAMFGANIQSISLATLSPDDKRTTFMIRNIPNKYTQPMLLECINETHFGKFDFLYLRMDFRNKCNVGYAFINFVNTDVVESFIKAHIGKKWYRFNSDKICSLSYATVQGRNALIEKFRNSSVMEEDPSYRPKIFYTSGSDIGQEEPFPGPTVAKDKGHTMMRRRGQHGRPSD